MTRYGGGRHTSRFDGYLRTGRTGRTDIVPSGGGPVTLTEPTLSAPVNTKIPAITGTAMVGQSLTVSLGSWTGYPAPSFAYQWRRSGASISGATAESYTLQAADYQASIDCVVTATNSQGNANATAAAVGPVAGTAPVNTMAPLVSGGSALGDVLSVTNGTWTGVPASFTYAYQWKRNGVAISGATAVAYMIVTADDASTITCAVTATNAAGSTMASSNSVTVVDFMAPVNTAAPAITGTPTNGQTLTGTTGTWTSNAGAVSYAYQWLRDGAAIGGATASSYVLQSADAGAMISLRVTATNAGGSAQATSGAVGPVLAGSSWILASGAWSDAGAWDDTAIWNG